MKQALIILALFVAGCAELRELAERPYLLQKCYSVDAGKPAISGGWWVVVCPA